MARLVLDWERFFGCGYYGGCEVVDEVETLAIERAKQLFGAAWANVQPHSGAQANAAVFLSFLNPGDKILGFDLSHGGHLSHGSPVNFSGKYFQAFFYGVEKETGLNLVYSIMRKASYILLNIDLDNYTFSIGRSEERRVGKECRIGCRFRWSPYH